MTDRRKLPKHKLISVIDDLEDRNKNLTARVKEIQKEAFDEIEQSDARRNVILDYEKIIRRLMEDRERLLTNLVNLAAFQRSESEALHVYRAELLTGIEKWRTAGGEPRSLLKGWQWDSEDGWTPK
jgi:hypothetical protein